MFLELQPIDEASRPAAMEEEEWWLEEDEPLVFHGPRDHTESNSGEFIRRERVLVRNASQFDRMLLDLPRRAARWRSGGHSVQLTVPHSALARKGRLGFEVEPWLKPADRIVARFAQENGGIYDLVRHQCALEELPQQGPPSPAERVAAIVRRPSSTRQSRDLFAHPPFGVDGWTKVAEERTAG